MRSPKPGVALLTGQRLGVCEDLSDILVHFDEQVVFLRHVIVPLGDDRIYPLSKRLTNNSVAHVYKPLSGEPVPVELIRKKG